MENLLSKKAFDEITEWTKTRAGELTTPQWATLLAMVLIDQEKVDSAWHKWELASFVKKLPEYNWRHPFHTQMHREGTSGTGYLREYITSDKIDAESKDRFMKGYNMLLDYCNDQIANGNLEIEWLLFKVIEFSWARSPMFNFDSAIVMKILDNSLVNDITARALVNAARE